MREARIEEKILHTRISIGITWNVTRDTRIYYAISCNASILPRIAQSSLSACARLVKELVKSTESETSPPVELVSPIPRWAYLRALSAKGDNGGPSKEICGRLGDDVKILTDATARISEESRPPASALDANPIGRRNGSVLSRNIDLFATRRMILLSSGVGFLSLELLIAYFATRPIGQTLLF